MRYKHRPKQWRTIVLALCFAILLALRAFSFSPGAEKNESDMLIEDDRLFQFCLNNSTPTAGISKERSNRRVVIVSVWTHYPEMMRLHVASVKAFLSHDSFDYLAVLNSRSAQVNTDLADMAARLNVVYLQIESLETDDSSAHHGYALNKALRNFLLYPETPLPLRDGDILFLLDSDIFLTERTNLIHELSSGYHIMTMEQRRGEVRYVWPNLLLLDMPFLGLYKELDFMPAIANDNAGNHWSLDSGGSTAGFLASHPELKFLGIHAPPDVCFGIKDDIVCDFLVKQQSVVVPSSSCRLPEMLTAVGRLEACRASLNSTGCASHSRYYHLGSAGSNWKGCPERFLEARRNDFQRFLLQRIFG